ncbi:hypothetical protein QUB63_29375 [Microcoleus sp. ARI1-B5]|uniref:hypothetical protein n=1 Tax=unclassified Microcoleus TaxID=2642155 RepID=UPI002FD55CB0
MAHKTEILAERYQELEDEEAADEEYTPEQDAENLKRQWVFTRIEPQRCRLQNHIGDQRRKND